MLNLKNGIYNVVYNKEFDLIIDATGSRAISFVFENEMKQNVFECPIVSCSISAKAKYGMLVTRMPKFSDGLETLFRESKIMTHYSEKFNSIADSVWSSNSENDTIQPEPGCSEPTFVASAIDTAWYASSFTNTVISNLNQLTDNLATVQFFSNSDFSIKQVPIFGSSIQKKDRRLKYSTMLYPAAKKEIEAAISSSNRINGEFKETGGLLFGEISEALNCAWIDFASEPPADSKFSESYFVCGKCKTQELNEYYSCKTKGTSEFIGMWHTHPKSNPNPSEIDLIAVIEMFENNEQCRKILLLIIGMSASNPVWEFHIFKRNEINNLMAELCKTAIQVI